MIPDPNLRTLALRALRDERGNLEGAAAYAAFTPRPYRVAVARAVIAFQAVYDYADAISEQPDCAHARNTYQLHQALLVALAPGAAHLDYYAYQDRRDDGGYLNCLVDKCRTALCLLPSLPDVTLQMRRAASRIVTYQCLNHEAPVRTSNAFERWSRKETNPESDLRWWETGAAAGSSLSVFALISAAARQILDTGHVAALESAYFPWIGSIHTLLDSLVDEREDAITSQHSLTARYTSHDETVQRLQALAVRASDHAKALPDGQDHMTILAAMVSFYLTSPQAKDPHIGRVSEQVLEALGDNAPPAMLVLRARQAVGRMAPKNRRHRPIVKFRTFDSALV
jgi:tetraprenyl-beta-curcumene synthase